MASGEGFGADHLEPLDQILAAVRAIRAMLSRHLDVVPAVMRQSVMSEYDEPGEVFAALVNRERALALGLGLFRQAAGFGFMTASCLSILSMIRSKACT
jgi:hypothetical protein